MKKFLLVLVVVLAQGCCSVPAEVAESADVLRDNTYALSSSYAALLERAGAPALEDGPEDETDEDKTARVEDHAEAWEKHVRHENALMGANNILADRMATWTAVCADKVDLKEPEDEEAEEPEETQPEAEPDASEGD